MIRMNKLGDLMISIVGRDNWAIKIKYTEQ